MGHCETANWKSVNLDNINETETQKQDAVAVPTRSLHNQIAIQEKNGRKTTSEAIFDTPPGFPILPQTQVNLTQR
jgi:hypothetical protein